MIPVRKSKVVYVLTRLKLDERDYLLFYAHPKWGDWSLIGGHVEPDEESDWDKAAWRETAEELPPLKPKTDFELTALLQGSIKWGPELSRSAGNAPTLYESKWYALRFLRDPRSLLSRLVAEDYLLVERSRVETGQDSDISMLVRRFIDAGANLDAVAYAWPVSLPMSEIALAHREAVAVAVMAS